MKTAILLLAAALTVGAQTSQDTINPKFQVQGQCNPNATCGLMPGEAVPAKKPVRTGRFKPLCRFDMSDSSYDIDICPDVALAQKETK
jgi:hypothetical protein